MRLGKPLQRPSTSHSLFTSSQHRTTSGKVGVPGGSYFSQNVDGRGPPARAPGRADVWTQSCSGSTKSYQHYLTVCNRQFDNLVRIQKSATSGWGDGLVGNSQGSRAASGPRKRAGGPPRTVERVWDRDSEACHGRLGLGIRVGIRWGSKGDPCSKLGDPHFLPCAGLGF